MNLTNITYRCISILLAALVFFTSGGLVLGKHHCKMMQKSELEGKQISCAVTGCQKGCCSTEFQFFKLDQDQQTTTLNFDLSKDLIQFITAYAVVFLSNDLLETVTPSDYNYRPPLISKDIPVLFESFLL